MTLLVITVVTGCSGGMSALQETAAETGYQQEQGTEAEASYQETQQELEDRELETQQEQQPEDREAEEQQEQQLEGQEPEEEQGKQPESQESSASIEETGAYTSKDQVALYLHTYGHLPDNYMTKKEAEALGWDSRQGNLWEVAPGMSIGGSRFGNYEGLLPDKKGRKYFECDIDYEGGYRGAKRIIYSNDGLIFYTEDHYKTFDQLY